MEKCMECEGEVEKKKVDYLFLGENLGKFEAEVCTKCGEQIFEEEVLEKIERITKDKGLWGLGAKTKVAQVGNSIAITISKKIAEFANLRKGEEVLVYPESKNKLAIEVP